MAAIASSSPTKARPNLCSLKTRERHDGKGGIEVVRHGSDGTSGAEKGRYVISSDCIATMTYPNGFEMTSFVARDGSRFTFTITKAPGQLPTSIAGWEVRVDD
jgi:hypothetical protein